MHRNKTAKSFYDNRTFLNMETELRKMKKKKLNIRTTSKYSSFQIIGFLLPKRIVSCGESY